MTKPEPEPGASFCPPPTPVADRFLNLDMYHGFRHLPYHPSDRPGISIQQIAIGRSRMIDE